MNENERNLFYRVLKDKITEEPSPELTSNIMRIVHQKAHREKVVNKILEILGFSLLGVVAIGFLCGYLYFYTDFTLPSLRIYFEMPSKIYIIITSIIFVFLLVDLYFRRKLYQNSQ
jgi:uncharacterized membrane protein (DUF373 family)